jgi:hypothetical protein
MIHHQIVNPIFWAFVAWLTLQLPWLVPVLIVALIAGGCFDAISTAMALKKTRFGVHEMMAFMQWLMDVSTRIGWPDLWMVVRACLGLIPAAILGYCYYALAAGAGTVAIFFVVAVLLGLVIRNNYLNAWKWPAGQKPY